MKRVKYADNLRCCSTYQTPKLHSQRGFLQSCFRNVAPVPAKRYFSSNPWDFTLCVVIVVRSGKTTNPLTLKPAEVRSSQGHPHIRWRDKTNSTMRKVRRSKIIQSLFCSLSKARRKGQKGSCERVAILFSLLLGQSCCVLPLLPSSQPLAFDWPQDQEQASCNWSFYWKQKFHVLRVYRTGPLICSITSVKKAIGNLSNSSSQPSTFALHLKPGMIYQDHTPFFPRI